MKIRYIVALLLCLFVIPAFAEDYDDDIYVDDGVPATPSVKQNAKKQQPSNKTYTPKNTKSSETFPKLEGHILTEFYANTLTKNSEKIQAGDKRTDAYLYAESVLRLRITEGLFAETKWFFEPTNDRLYTGDIYAKNPGYYVGSVLGSDFYGQENHVKRKFQTGTYGLGVETLNIGYKNSNLALAVGKIDPTFGSAFDRSRFSGIYGIAMPEEYELTEAIGGYVSALLPFGNITFNAFFNDTTDLSNTMFRRRGKNDANGGVGNTDKLNNFSLTFDGKFDNLSLNLGFRYLDVDLEEEEAESGFVAGAEYLVELPYSVNFLPFVELAYFHNYNGMPSRRVGYATVFLPIIFENWHFIVSNTTKYDDEKGYHGYTSYLTQISVGYKFDFGLMFDFGRIWERYAKKADGFAGLGPKDKWTKRADSWAFMISYMFQF